MNHRTERMRPTPRTLSRRAVALRDESLLDRRAGHRVYRGRADRAAIIASIEGEL